MFLFAGSGLAMVQDLPSNAHKEHEDRAEDNVIDSSGRTRFVLGELHLRLDELPQHSSESREERINASTPLQEDRSC